MNRIKNILTLLKDLVLGAIKGLVAGAILSILIICVFWGVLYLLFVLPASLGEAYLISIGVNKGKAVDIAWPTSFFLALVTAAAAAPRVIPPFKSLCKEILELLGVYKAYDVYLDAPDENKLKRENDALKLQIANQENIISEYIEQDRILDQKYDKALHAKEELTELLRSADCSDPECGGAGFKRVDVYNGVYASTEVQECYWCARRDKAVGGDELWE